MDPLADAASSLGAPVIGDGKAHATATFSATLPVFAGHFPGNPLVPGVHHVALIAHLARLALSLPELRITGIERCKWLRPLLPDQALTVEVTWRPDGDDWRIDGVLRDGVAVACQVRLRLGR
jgi:3-hydroxyacyl-[acyl-carrier-protein] dehydratase